MLMLILLLFLVVLCFLMFILPVLTKTKTNSNYKMSSLEAGFYPFLQAHLSFSLQFVLLMIIFIIFDTEILFVFSLSLKSFFLLNFLILVFLYFTLFLEWKWSKLVWVK